MKLFTHIAAACAVALACATPAMAQERTTGLLTMSGRAFTETKAVNVETADLNLASDRDQAKLAGRLKRAMASICGSAPANAAVRLQREYGDCKRSLNIDSHAVGDPVKLQAFSVAFSNLD